MEQGNAGRRRELNTRDFTIRIANKGQLTVDNRTFILWEIGNHDRGERRQTVSVSGRDI